MAFTKYNSSSDEGFDAQVEVVEAPREPDVLPEDRPYVYEEGPASALSPDKRPY